MESTIRRAMGIKPMGMTTKILQQEVTEGGVELCTARTYLLFQHASFYQKMIDGRRELSGGQQEEYEGWRGTLIKNRLERRMVNWDRNPPQGVEMESKRWPLAATSAKAYSLIRRKLRGSTISKDEVNKVPLWNSCYFST